MPRLKEEDGIDKLADYSPHVDEKSPALTGLSFFIPICAAPNCQQKAG